MWCLEHSSFYNSPELVESKTFPFIICASLSGSLQPLSFHWYFPSLSLFYRYCTELSQCVLSSLMGACNIRQATLSHSYSVHLPYARNNQYSQTYKYTTSQFWNTLPTSICPSYYGLTYSTSYAMCLDTSKVLGHNLYFFPGWER